MPLMTKIRESLSTVFAIFAGVFVVYIVLDWGMDITGRKQASRRLESQEIGSIKGEPIYYTDFIELVQEAAENQKKQTGENPDEEDLKTIRDQIWNQFVEQRLFGDEISRLGITVTDQEIIDWVKGDNPPEFLVRQFTDSLGNFNRQAYEAAINDPRNKEIWIRIEDALRKQREREKLQSVLLSSIRIAEGEVIQRFQDQNIKYEMDYVLFDPNRTVTDAEITITDDELHRYYNEHSEDYKNEATRKLKYITFAETASKGDTASVEADMEDILRQAKAGIDFIELAKTYSEVQPSDVFFKHGELPQERENAVFSVKVGEIVGPILEHDGYHLIKVLEFRPGKDEFIRASHILINIENNDSVNALKQAKDIISEIKRGSSFEELAKKYSKDPGSGSRGGDLGWFGKGRMVKQFEDAALKAAIGQIVGPVRTQFGYHIIKVTARDKREVKIADIHMQIRISSQTKSENFQRAQDFAFLAKEGNFEKEASLSKYDVLETQPFRKGGYIPGFGPEPAVSRFAFNGELGDISDAMPVRNAYTVFMISEIKEAGIQPFNEVKNIVESRLKLEKKISRLMSIAAELKNSASSTNDLQIIAAKRSGLTVQHEMPFTLSGSATSIGRDLKLFGRLPDLKVGQISEPFEGQRGVFIVKLLSKSNFDTTLFNAQKDIIRTQLLTDRRNRYFNEWYDNLKKSADIVDNRDLFFR